MRATLSLWLKEWLETRWILYTGLGAFLVLPGMNALWYLRRMDELGHVGARPDHFLATVLSLGAVFSGLAGAVCGSRDTRGGVWWFARSRPIGLARWLGAKYLIGLAMALGPIVLALVVQLFVDGIALEYQRYWPHSTTRPALLAHTLTLLAIYSAGFAAGSITRQPVNAVILTAIFALLLYFLPVLVPPLAPMNVWDMLDHRAFAWLAPRDWQRLAAGLSDADDPNHIVILRLGVGVLIVPRAFLIFAGATLVISVVVSAIGLFALWRDWSIALGRQAMAWTLAGVALLMFTVSAFQLGTNLTPDSVTPLSETRELVAVSLKMRRDSGAAVVLEWPGRPYTLAPTTTLRAGGVRLDGSPPPDAWRETGVKASGRMWIQPKLLLSEVDPGVAYGLLHDYEFKPGGVSVATRVWLRVDDFRSGGESATVDLSPHLLDSPDGVSEFALASLGTRLFVSVQVMPPSRQAADDWRLRVVELDASDPLSPRFVRTIESPLLASGRQPPTPEGINIPLPPIEGLDPRERLRVAAQLRSFSQMLITEELIVWPTNDEGMRVYRLANLTKTTASFAPVGELRPTPLERLFSHSHRAAVLDDGYLYVLSQDLQPGVTVYDLRDPTRPRRAWHYVTPNDSPSVITPTGDGRVVAAGADLHVLRVPDRE